MENLRHVAAIVLPENQYPNLTPLWRHADLYAMIHSKQLEVYYNKMANTKRNMFTQCIHVTKRQPMVSLDTP